jgi:orotidine-5'-phosphate decarboxylase
LADISLARLKLALAADVPLAEGEALYRRVQPFVGCVKVGLSLFVEHGPKAVQTFTSMGASVFLDLKLHDIPNTVALAARRAGEMGVTFLTVHAAGGAAMVRAAADAAREGAAARGHPPPRVLAVTLLTSLSEADAREVGLSGAPEDVVSRLAALAQRAGAGGVVCSAAEAGVLRARHGPSLFLCTPAIRPQGGASADQSRVETPRSAIAAGSDLLVVGRPIYQAQNPEAAAEAIVQEAAAALAPESASGR